MASYSQSSKDRLSTVHVDLQTLFNEVIKHYDCTIVSGLRTAEEQAKLYAQGRTEPGNIVTYKDGYEKKSKHQGGNAVDVIPYPSGYKDVDEMIKFSGFVLGVATMLKVEGKMNNNIEWGGDWRNFSDKPHFQIKQIQS